MSTLKEQMAMLDEIYQELNDGSRIHKLMYDAIKINMRRGQGDMYTRDILTEKFSKKCYKTNTN